MQGDDVLAQFLLDAGLLSRAQLLGVKAQNPESLGRALIDTGLLTEEQVSHALAKSLQIPYLTLEPDEVSAEALMCMPEPFSRTHAMIAFAKEGNVLHVAATDLHHRAALEALRLPYSVRLYLTNRATIKKALVKYQQALGQQYALHIVSQSSPEQLVDSLLLHALSQQAHAVHLEQSSQGLLVRYRIGGVLHDAMLLPPQASGAIARLKQLAKIPHAGVGEGRFAIAQGDTRIVVAVSILPTVSDLEFVTLHLSRSGALQSLGLHGEALEKLHHTLHAPAGLVVVSGPTQSGVTTLLYALAEHAGGASRSVVTVEEHVEARVAGATQMEVAGSGVSLATRIRAALRSDPDVLMISSLQDTETAALAIHAANRGVLVLAGMQASAVPDVLQSLSAAVSPRIVSSVLKTVISTRLVRRLCANHSPARLSRGEVDLLEQQGVRINLVLQALKQEGHIAQSAQWKDVPFYRAVHCSDCRGGFVGHLGVQEVVHNSLSLKDALLSGASPEEFDDYIRAEAPATGALSLLEDGIYKAALGLTTTEEVFESLL